MFEFEVIIVIVRLRTEPNFLHLHLLSVRLCLFLLFLLCVEELLVVDNSAHGRSSRRSYLDKVEVLLISNLHRLLKRVDALFYIVADKAHFIDSADLIVDTMRVFFNNSTATRSHRGCCYSFFLLKWVNNQKSAQKYYFFLKHARKTNFFFTFFLIYLRA